METKSLEEIREDANNFAEALSLEYYLIGNKNKSNADLILLYEKYKHLSREETILFAGSTLNYSSDAEQKRKLSYLYSSLLLFFEGQYLSDINNQILHNEKNALYQYDGITVSLSTAIHLLLNEPERQKRENIECLRAQLFKHLKDLYVERTKKNQEIASHFNFKSYGDFKQNTCGIDLHTLKEQLEFFLKKTENTYTKYLQYYLKTVCDVELKYAKLHDIIYLCGADKYPQYFQAVNFVEKSQPLLKEMGIDIYVKGNVSYEIGQSQNKNYQAFCYPLNMPKKVILVSKSNQGAMAYYNFHHELGHALHFGYVSESLPFEYKLLGDDSVTEGYAMLFGNLISNSKWMKLITNITVSEQYKKFNYFKELYLFRRHAIRFLSNFITYNTDGSLDDKEEAYKNLFVDTCKVPIDPANYWGDYDSNYYSGRYLRAWIFGAQLEDYLKHAFGDEWFINRKAGEIFKEVWALGEKYDANELLQRYCSCELNIDVLLNKYIKNLS